jgi:hypothetical protein
MSNDVINNDIINNDIISNDEFESIYRYYSNDLTNNNPIKEKKCSNFFDLFCCCFIYCFPNCCKNNDYIFI